MVDVVVSFVYGIVLIVAQLKIFKLTCSPSGFFSTELKILYAMLNATVIFPAFSDAWDI